LGNAEENVELDLRFGDGTWFDELWGRCLIDGRGGGRGRGQEGECSRELRGTTLVRNGPDRIRTSRERRDVETERDSVRTTELELGHREDPNSL
jgi:hypothetical protein